MKLRDKGVGVKREIELLLKPETSHDSPQGTQDKLHNNTTHKREKPNNREAGERRASSGKPISLLPKGCFSLFC